MRNHDLCAAAKFRKLLNGLDGYFPKTIGKHISNALREEVDSSTVAKFATVQEEGRKKMIPLKEVLEIYISILADGRYIRRCKRRQQIFSIL